MSRRSLSSASIASSAMARTRRGSNRKKTSSKAGHFASTRLCLSPARKMRSDICERKRSSPRPASSARLRGVIRRASSAAAPTREAAAAKIGAKGGVAVNPASPIEPYLFHPPVIIDAIDLQLDPLDFRPPASRRPHVVQDRAHDVFLQLAVDLPNELSALLLVGLHRLPVDQLVQLGVAVMRVIAVGSAHVILIKILIGVVETRSDQALRHHKIAAHQLRQPACRFGQRQLGVDPDLL